MEQELAAKRANFGAGQSGMAVRYLCSQLVRIWIDGSAQPARPAILEQIDPFEAVVALEDPLPTQVDVSLRGGPVAIPAYVELCRRRETDYEAVLVFRDGYRWSPELWTPDHLLPVAAKTRAASSGH